MSKEKKNTHIIVDDDGEEEVEEVDLESTGSRRSSRKRKLTEKAIENVTPEKKSKSKSDKVTETPGKKNRSKSDKDTENTPNKKSKSKDKSEKKKDYTPEKVPVVVHTPRKSRRSKDLSPPPLRHRQNRMPEQVNLIKDGKSHVFFTLL